MRGGNCKEDQEDNISGDVTCCCRFPSCLECRETQPLQESHITRHKHTYTSISTPNKGVFLLTGFGVVFLVASYSMFALRPVDYIITNKLSLTDGSLLFNLWTKPPVDVYIKVYAFNITNPFEYMSGKAKRLKVEEIGPYVYKETLLNTNVSFNSNNSVTYMPRRSVRFEPSMSARDPRMDYIYTPNVALLGIASMLHNSSTLVNVGLATLARYLDSQPLINITAHEMLWGYDEPLVRLGATFLPNWIPFSRLGLMDRMMDEGVNIVTMTLNKSHNMSLDEYGRRRKIYTFENFNGLTTLPQWPGGACASLKGVSEGVLHPRPVNSNETVVVYRKAFCRMLPMQFNESRSTEDGFPAYWYKLPEDAFDSPDKNPDNACYCRPEVAPCLLSGLSDIAPCYYSIPLALSLPHYLRGDPRLFETVEGLSPNVSAHDTVLAIQPDLGLPMTVHSRMQLNLAVHNTRLNPRTARFNNSTLPIFWIDWYFELPDALRRLFYLVLYVAPALQTGGVVVFAFLGVLLLAIAACSCSRKNTAVATKILSKSQHLLEKNAGEQLLARAHIVTR